MPSSTWTPRAVASKAARTAVRLWRGVEAQHVASTRRLVDNLDEQRVLEEVLDAAKPPVPAAAVRLHYLLFTPFRYPAPLGSRFRAPIDPGVFYGAESVRTACAEVGYWRWRFLRDSPALAMLGPAPQTLFQASVRAIAIDLEQKPFSRDAKLWRDPDDYTATQAFGRVAREAGVGLLRYASVRDPQPGRCGAVLDPGAFSAPKPSGPTETWLLIVTQDYAVWQRDRDAWEFDLRRWK
ncbi:MAG: RES family NAD+ phosphorylase [Betaproteobacteria bacterium]|nr:RES family NAD+ phosphorylase [Betaproteobacteria bacterium]